MATNKGLLFGAALANGLNAFLDAREKGDLQRQRQALATVEQQMKQQQLANLQQVGEYQGLKMKDYPIEQQAERERQKDKAEAELIRQRTLASKQKETERENQRGFWSDAFEGAGDAVKDFYSSFKRTTADKNLSYKINQDQEEAKDKQKARDLLINNANSPEEVERYTKLFNELDAGVPTTTANKLFDVREEELFFEKLTKGLGLKEVQFLNRVRAAEQLKVDLANVSGTKQAITAQIRIEQLRLDKKLTQKALTEEDYLTVQECNALGLEYGTRREDAWGLRRVPNRFEFDVIGGALYRIDKTAPEGEPQLVLEPSESLGSEELGQVRAMRKDFENKKVAEDAYVMRMQVGRLTETIEQLAAENRLGELGSFVGIDQSLVMIFNKLTDPDSVVRESEYARTARNLPFISQLKGWIGAKMDKGGAGLTNVERLALVRLGLVYAQTANMALLGAKANEALSIEGMKSFVKPSDVLGHRQRLVDGRMINTSDYTAADWLALYEEESSKATPTIDQVVDVTPEDFNLSNKEKEQLSGLFSRFSPTGGSLNQGQSGGATTSTGDEYDPDKVIRMMRTE